MSWMLGILTSGCCGTWQLVGYQRSRVSNHAISWKQWILLWCVLNILCLETMSHIRQQQIRSRCDVLSDLTSFKKTQRQRTTVLAVVQSVHTGLQFLLWSPWPVTMNLLLSVPFLYLLRFSLIVQMYNQRMGGLLRFEGSCRRQDGEGN